MVKQLTAVGYPRVSSDGQGDNGYSLGEQIRVIEEYCLRHNINLLAHYREVESAKNVSGRPQFKAALKHVYNSPIDFIIVTNLDRFSRDTLDAEIVNRGLKKRGKSIVSVQESYLTPHEAAEDPDVVEYLEDFKRQRMIAAQAERRQITKRCSSGKKRKASQGGWTGHRPPYEYDVVQGELVRNEERARTVRLIWRLRQLKNRLGEPMFTYKAIAAYLDGNNNLIDPVTGERGRWFPPYGSRQFLRKRNTPRIQGGSRLWNYMTVAIIIKDIASGERQRWERQAILGHAS